MRIIYFILFILSFDDCFSQDSPTHVFHLNKLPPEGVLLDKNWKFQEGDNPEYSQPYFNDEHWMSIDPTKDIRDIPTLWKTNVCWFRLHFVFDTPITQKAIAVLVEQTGASEIYLNGQSIRKFGTISNDPNEVQAITPPKGTYIELPASAEEQVLAIRFAIQKNIPYIVFFGRQNKALSLSAMEMGSVEHYFQSNVNLFLDYLRAGLFLMLALLHLGLFYFNSSQKANLYFSIFAILFAFISLLISLVYTHVYLAVTKQIILTTVLIGSLVSLLYFLLAVYKIFNYSKRLVYWVMVAGSLLSLIMVAVNYHNGSYFGLNIFPLAIFLECIRITLMAVKEKKRGAKIIMAGAIGYLLFYFLFQVFPFSDAIYNHITFNLGYIMLPVSISLYLALEASFTSHFLEEKLKEVQQLSDKTIAQEKEKQEIIATQNELQIKAMVATQEQERKRISRDLHDDVGTKLSALNLFLSSLDEKAKCTNNSEIRSLTQSSRQFIKETMRDVRQLLLNLSPTVLEEFGYTTAVEGLVNKINETKQMHFDLIVFGVDHRLKKEYELALYRITQELINNVLKHAEAKHVSLQIGQRDGKIILMMEDDGKGFDVSAHKDGYGLSNLDARAKLMQGSMTIDSKPGNGTSVLVEIPYNYNGI